MGEGSIWTLVKVAQRLVRGATERGRREQRNCRSNSAPRSPSFHLRPPGSEEDAATTLERLLATRKQFRMPVNAARRALHAKPALSACRTQRTLHPAPN